MHDPSQRQSLRRQLRRQRQALSAHQRREAGRALARRLLRDPRLRRARHIAVYQACGSEITLEDFCSVARRSGKHLYLPRVHGTRMNFLAASGPLQHNRFGIAEPAAGTGRPGWAIQVMLLPLLGVDRQGNRLGQGGGYYDRYLARLRFRRPWLIGVAYDCQIVDALQPASWDQPLDALITPQQTLNFRTPAWPTG